MSGPGRSNGSLLGARPPSTSMPASAVLTPLVANQWWLVGAVMVVMGSGFAARLGYLPDSFLPQNDSGWVSGSLLLSIPLLGALHVACVQIAAGGAASLPHLWLATRVRLRAFMRLALVSLVLTVPTAITLSLLGHLVANNAALGEGSLPLIAGLLTFAPSVLVTDVDSSAATAVATSLAWALRRESRAIVAASVAVTAAEVALVAASPHLGWARLPLAIILGATAVGIAGATAAYTVAHVHPEAVAWVRTAPAPIGLDWRPVAATVAIAAAAAYTVVGSQPLLLGRTAGSGGSDTFQTAWASVKNAGSVPLTLTASADSPTGAPLDAVGFTSASHPLFGESDRDIPHAGSVTLWPGEQTNVFAEWTPRVCTDTGSSVGVTLHLWVTSRVGPLRQRHMLRTSALAMVNCR